MKFTLLLTALLSLSQAAPVKIVTRVHTAAPVTEWQTYTTGTVTITGVHTVNGPPPNAATEAPAPTTSTTEAAPTEAAPTEAAPTEPAPEEPEPTSSAPAPVNAAPSSSAPEQEVPTTSSFIAKPVEETTPATSSAPTTSTPWTPTTSSTPWTPTTSSTPWTPTTSSTPWTPTTSSTPWTPTTSSAPWTPTTSSTPTTTSTPPPGTTSTAPTTTSSTAQPTETSSNLNDFEQEILDEHNKKRDLHGVQHLTWDTKLVDFAVDYAKDSFSCDNVQLIHSHGPYGENLAAGYEGGKSPVDAWYDEIEYYNFDQPGFNEQTGHFTQLVWKDTSRIGCAYVTCDNSWRQYTICEYSDSRGNVVGTDPKTGKSFFEQNVVRPISG